VLNTNSTITIDIRDFSGKIVRNLISEKQPAGKKSVKWDGTDNSGQQVPAGIYFYTIRSGIESVSGKIIYLP
jgi:flagellar hook assembly protein FlgD